MGERKRKRRSNGSRGRNDHPDRRGPGTIPVITKLGINFENGSGRFDCLALMPTPPAGTRGSGSFDNNIMYVTGPITRASLEGESVVLTGTATVTGLGAGTDKPFTVTADRGGPGARVVLVVSGLTFVETLLDGSIPDLRFLSELPS
jgi:hypothetical protein